MTTFLGLPSVHAPAGVGAPARATRASRPPPGGRSATPSCAATSAGPPRRSASKRARVVAEVPDWEELRDGGRALKAATMARLPELLEQLEER